MDSDTDARTECASTRPKASDNKAYVPLGTVVVFQVHNHP